MFPLFETICINNGIILNNEWHQFRYEKSFYEYYSKPTFDKLISNIIIPAIYKTGIIKMRISYDDTSKKIEYDKYIIKHIKTLKIVEDNTISYNLKFTDRTHINRLFELRDNCDEILILKNGYVTDTSFCNIVFFNGKYWITPSTPLLKGTTRERLLSLGQIKQCIIHKNQIKNFNSFKLINAMRDFNNTENIAINNIII